MQAGMVSVVVLLFCVGVALCARPQAILRPFTADGFDTVILDDMSFVNEINIQTYSQNNFTMYVYGQSAVRTVFPGPSFYVGSTPNEYWHVPFIDFHTFQSGNDVWGIGPVNAIYGRNRNQTQTFYSGFQYEVAIVTTKQIPNSNGRWILEQPLGFEGTFFSVRVVGFDPSNVIGYFCGFFPNHTNPGQLHFGVLRAHFNSTNIAAGNLTPDTPAWYHNSSIDRVVLNQNAQLVAFNADFKPMLFHARNVSATAPPNTTYLIVVDPYVNNVNLVTGNFDPTIAITQSQATWMPSFGGLGFGSIVSAAVYYPTNILFLGISVAGTGTGWLDVLHIANLTQRFPSILLPTNYSDPRALVIDDFAGHLYVGMNGGAAILKLDIATGKFIGYQNLPYYLHRTWRGQVTREHVYFITNEQHSKVYRVAKADFCPTTCMEFGYCKAGKCVCGEHWDLKDGKCEWHQMIVEKKIAKTEKGGEIALGIFFAISTVAAGAGWYLVWRSRRGYQPV